VGNGFTLDSTSMRCPLSAAAASAGEAADDDAEEGDDGVDDCLKTSSDGVDNGHDAVSDGAELESVLGTVCIGRQVRIRTTDLMQETTAPIIAVLFW